MAASKTKARKPASEKAAVTRSETRVIDLDAARTARAEARGDKESPRIRLDGQEWELPIELPLTAMLDIEEGRFRQGLGGLLGDDGEEILKQLALDDIESLTTGLYETYGIDEGN